MAVVVSAIAYVSLLVGELVPKRMALANPERAAAALAPAMNALAGTALPLVWVLTTSTEAVVRRIGLRKARTAAVTEEEVRSLIAAGTQAGIFVPQEREMIEGVMRLADRSVDVIMTPRPDHRDRSSAWLLNFTGKPPLRRCSLTWNDPPAMRSAHWHAIARVFSSNSAVVPKTKVACAGIMREMSLRTLTSSSAAAEMASRKAATSAAFRTSTLWNSVLATSP
jgi:hypothetical protein